MRSPVSSDIPHVANVVCQVVVLWKDCRLDGKIISTPPLWL